MNTKLSKPLIIIFSILTLMILLLGIFRLGMQVGYERSFFAKNFGENYRRNFIDPNAGFSDRSGNRMLPPGGHGAVGKVIDIELPNIVIADRDNIEKTIIVETDTTLRKFRDPVDQKDVRLGDFITVIGSPNAMGHIEAKFIRIIPDPASGNQ